MSGAERGDGAAGADASTETAAVVTGATGGIGRWIARGLARGGRPVVLVGRDRGRGEAACAWIRREVPEARLELVVADLSSLAATRALASEIAARHPRLGLLVNNAGVFRTRREETREGHEMVLAVNHLSPFVLTRALAPALAAGAPSRVVNVGSSTSDRARIDPDNLELRRGWGMVRAYSQSKLALMLTTFDIARAWAGSGIVANVVHPGTVATGLVRAPGVVGLAWRVMAPFLVTEAEGADTPLHVATDPALAVVTGCYFKRRQEAAPNPRARDPALAAAVRAATERLVGA